MDDNHFYYSYIVRAHGGDTYATEAISSSSVGGCTMERAVPMRMDRGMYPKPCRVDICGSYTIEHSQGKLVLKP